MFPCYYVHKNGGDIVSNIVSFPEESERDRIMIASRRKKSQENHRTSELRKEFKYLAKCFSAYLESAKGIVSNEEKLRYMMTHEEEISVFIDQAMDMGLFSRFV